MNSPDSVAELQAELLQRLAQLGQATVFAERLSLAISARCHEEVRVWVENFCRAQGLTVEEGADGREFHLSKA